MSDEIILEARNMTKRYPGQTALKNVSLRVRRGATNVLIGENGAGKSTLMRILSGVERADEGELLLDGRVIHISSPREAAAKGISIVHQELALLPNLDVAENIFAGRELVKSACMVDRPQQEERSRGALARLLQPMAVTTEVARITLGRRQLVELARTLAHGARIVILDEPTSALSSAETEALFTVLAELKRQGVTLIYISHRLHELLYLGDFFTVLRGGVVVGEGARAEVDRRWITDRMSGGRHEEEASHAAVVVHDAALTVRGLRSHGAADGRPLLRGIDLTIGRGEIVGMYGLLGSGRTELAEALAGASPAEGEVRLNGKLLPLRSVDDAVRAGIVLVPEDRQQDGLVPDLSIRENILLCPGGALCHRRDETARVQALASQLNLRVRNLELPVTTLSGGNQQKVLLARCLLRSPAVLLLDEPTRGIDVGAKAEIYRILRRLAVGGLAILFTSSEIEETRTLADRVMVLRDGRIAAEFAGGAWTDEQLFTAASPVLHAAEVA